MRLPWLPLLLASTALAEGLGNVETDLDEIEQRVGDLTLAGNLNKSRNHCSTGDPDPLCDLKYDLEDGGHNGVLVDVQNYSGLNLTDPALYIYTGKNLIGNGKVNKIDTLKRDAFVFRHQWRLARGDTGLAHGAMSWLVLKQDGSVFTGKDSKHQYRLWLYWESTNRRCTTENPNYVAVRFLKSMHKNKRLASRNHGAYFPKLQNGKMTGKDTAKHGNDMFAEAKIGPGCMPTLTLRVGSKDRMMTGVTGAVESLGLAGENISMFSFMLAGLGLIAAIICVCGSITKVRSWCRRRRHEKQEKQREEEKGAYSKVSQQDPGETEALMASEGMGEKEKHVV